MNLSRFSSPLVYICSWDQSTKNLLTVWIYFVLEFIRFFPTPPSSDPFFLFRTCTFIFLPFPPLQFLWCLHLYFFLWLSLSFNNVPSIQLFSIYIYFLCFCLLSKILILLFSMFTSHLLCPSKIAPLTSILKAVEYQNYLT